MYNYANNNRWLGELKYILPEDGRVAERRGKGAVGEESIVDKKGGLQLNGEGYEMQRWEWLKRHVIVMYYFSVYQLYYICVYVMYYISIDAMYYVSIYVLYDISIYVLYYICVCVMYYIIIIYVLYYISVCVCCTSAGVGRTGVFIGLVTAMQLMKANQPFVVLDLVRRMRDHRAGCVQTSVWIFFVLLNRTLQYYWSENATTIISCRDVSIYNRRIKLAGSNCSSGTCLLSKVMNRM